MALTREEVAKIAHLARLELAPGELDRFGKQLEAILGYVEKLNELDLKGAEPTTHVLPLTDREREDKVAPGMTPEDLEKSAPDSRHGMVRVPKIMEDA